MKLIKIKIGKHVENCISDDGDKWFVLPMKYQGLNLIELIEENVRNDIEINKETYRSINDLRLGESMHIVSPNASVWGAGLNYKNHAKDLNTIQPESGPGSYLRPNTCLINNGEKIIIPIQSERVTAEAELGILIGKSCKDVNRDNWKQVVAGVTVILDMTAEDIIRKNPRYIPWAKGFDTFCSVGPQLVTLDEVENKITSLRVSTVLNEKVVATSIISDMLYDIGYLVKYFSSGRTLLAGTVICTGTPGAAVITSGDHVEAIVDQVGQLSHIVQ